MIQEDPQLVSTFHVPLSPELLTKYSMQLFFKKVKSIAEVVFLKMVPQDLYIFYSLFPTPTQS